MKALPDEEGIETLRWVPASRCAQRMKALPDEEGIETPQGALNGTKVCV